MKSRRLIIASLAALAVACGDAGGVDGGLPDAERPDARMSEEDASAPIVDGGECPLDTACDDGDACTQGDRCTPAGCVGTPRTCDAPPSAECIGDTLRSYAAAGVCEAGNCRYEPTDAPCVDGCVSGADARCAEPPPRAWVAIGGSGDHVCAVRATGEVHCWGSDAAGELGDGTPSPRHLAPVQAVGVTNAVEVEGGGLIDGHTCAVLDTGRVSCWGLGTSGQLGQGVEASSTTPVEAIGVTDAVEVAAGIGFTCARLATGQVSCWGHGDSGALGNGSRTGSPTPMTIDGLTDVVQIVAGISHACALDRGGQVWCWGYNGSHQMGTELSATLYQTTPIAVMGVDDATQIAAGSSFNCAVRPGGVSCWGANAYGQLGSGSVSERVRTPVTTSLPGAVQVAAGQGHTCVRFGDGSVQCWGRNQSGQLGNRMDADSLSPVDVFGLTGAHDLHARGFYTCAMVGDTAQCWGSNYDGTLGVGTRDNSLQPVEVWLP